MKKIIALIILFGFSCSVALAEKFSQQEEAEYQAYKEQKNKKDKFEDRRVNEYLQNESHKLELETAVKWRKLCEKKPSYCGGIESEEYKKLIQDGIKAEKKLKSLQ